MADEKDKLILARDSHRIPSSTRLLNTEPIAETDIVIDVAGSSEVKKSKKSKKSKEKKKEGDSGKEKKKKHHRERPAETPAEDQRKHVKSEEEKTKREKKHKKKDKKKKKHEEKETVPEKPDKSKKNTEREDSDEKKPKKAKKNKKTEIDQTPSKDDNAKTDAKSKVLKSEPSTKEEEEPTKKKKINFVVNLAENEETENYISEKAEQIIAENKMVFIFISEHNLNFTLGKRNAKETRQTNTN